MIRLEVTNVVFPDGSTKPIAKKRIVPERQTGTLSPELLELQRLASLVDQRPFKAFVEEITAHHAKMR